MNRNKLRHNQDISSVYYMILGCLLYSIMYSLVKYLSFKIHPISLVFYRNFLALIIVFPWVLKTYKVQYLVKSFTLMNFIRGILGFLSMALWFIAITGTSISLAVSLSFLTPIITCLFALIMFKEKLNVYKVVSLSLGALGVFIILKPDVNAFNQYSICALLSCFTWAGSNIIIKKLTVFQKPILIVFYMTFVITLISFPWFVNNFYSPRLKEIVLILMMAILSNLSPFLIAKSFENSNLTFVMPFDYSRLIFSITLAYILFGEVITLEIFVGGIIILLAEILILNNKDTKNN